MTTQPAAAARGACSAEIEPPAENRAMSVPAKSNPARSATVSSRSPNRTRLPAERALASATISPTGKPRSARIESMTSPTAPVAPTTATLYCFDIVSIPE